MLLLPGHAKKSRLGSKFSSADMGLLNKGHIPSLFLDTDVQTLSGDKQELISYSVQIDQGSGHYAII